MLELVRRILALMASDLEPIVLNEAPGEIRHQYLSAAKARRTLDWHPQFNFDQGLELTIDWYRRFFEEAS